jgi:hypothetical protein
MKRPRNDDARRSIFAVKCGPDHMDTRLLLREIKVSRKTDCYPLSIASRQQHY